ncbi:MAG TPA: PepSY domain-containing protein [Candidatus Eisenbacteria bacterium]|nr:PepSY domain-containing protein [Candidatus Eisenbacteria bacterium]
MKRFLALACATIALPVALAHANPPKHDKITYESAKKAAAARVPGGTLTAHQFIRDHDREIYSFQFVEPGKSGVKRVKVDAFTGKVLKVKHQSIKSAQEERAKEMKTTVAKG